MNIQQKILKLLKERPRGKIALMKSIPEELPQAVEMNLNALIVQGKLLYDGKNFSVKSRPLKYGNKITEVDGMKFASKLEADRYSELKLMEKAGEINNLEIQVPFVVADAIVWEGKTLPSIKYVADFVYYDIREKITVVEDSKGHVTSLYAMKRLLFLNRYPQYRFKETRK